MNRDDVFQNTAGRASDFKFDQRVAEVFDDMLTRSVPPANGKTDCRRANCVGSSALSM